MASAEQLAAEGLSGHAVHGTVAQEPAKEAISAAGQTVVESLEDAASEAVDLALRAVDLACEAVGRAADAALQIAAVEPPSAAATTATEQLSRDVFSWSGYVQALGIMCLLLAALWFAVWAIRRWGRFSFLPRPGSLPRGSLAMEAQMPLGPRKGLMVVRFFDRRLLLGVTEHQISLLTEVRREDERVRKDFESVLLGNARDLDGSDGHRPVD